MLHFIDATNRHEPRYADMLEQSYRIRHDIFVAWRGWKALDAPLVWTMHDKHLGTGACGYPEFWECQRWQIGCGRCPKAKSNGWPLDFTHFVFARKQRILNSIQMAVVAPNQWMLDFIATGCFIKSRAASVSMRP